MSRRRSGYISTGMPAVDDMLGGGLLRGSVTLIGGFPGSGKTTLALQWAAHVRGRLYSAEQPQEALDHLVDRVTTGQARHRAKACPNLDAIDQELADVDLQLVVIDTIQAFGILPHKVVERAAKWAARENLAAVVLAHLNRDGEIYGGACVEHAADTCLGIDYDGDGSSGRLLHIVGKHRHGEVDVPPVRLKLTASGLAVVGDEGANTTTLN